MHFPSPALGCSHSSPRQSFSQPTYWECQLHIPVGREHKNATYRTCAKDSREDLGVVAHEASEGGRSLRYRTSLLPSDYGRKWSIRLFYSPYIQSTVLCSISHKLGNLFIKKIHEHATAMDRRSFMSLFTSNLAILLFDEMPSLAVPESTTKKKIVFDEQRLFEQNKRIQELNSAPPDFPIFIREGFDVKVITNDKYVRCNSGLIYLDIQQGQGDCPKDGQQVVFHYIGYNESARQVDNSYRQGQPAKTRIGVKGMIPGFEEGILTMKPGGKRRIVVPPELGPPVGPSTFFSAKQFEVFDVELLAIRDCMRRTIGFYSDVVCD